jgi:hypothetical protein
MTNLADRLDSFADPQKSESVDKLIGEGEPSDAGTSQADEEDLSRVEQRPDFEDDTSL